MSERGARWRNYATVVVMTGVVVAGCSSQPAVPRGSATSCYQFGVEAIQRHVTVTTVPAACQGLSQLEVNVAVDRALQAAAAGVRGKARQRQLIGRDSPYLADLIHAVPAPGQATVAAPQSGPPSRGALGLAALGTICTSPVALASATSPLQRATPRAIAWATTRFVTAWL